MRHYFLLLGSLAGALAVILGAFGAHGLETILEPKMLQRFHTGVEYQFYHAFALLAVGVYTELNPSRYGHYAGYCFVLGIILFSGSLYCYVISGIKLFVMVTPIGGMAFILGWLLLSYAIWAQRQ